jgi:hypothetical protein
VRVQAAPGPGPSKDAMLDGFVPYVYRGTGEDTLTARLSMRGLKLSSGHSRQPGPKAKPADDRCDDCGYVITGRNHKIQCEP